MPYNQFRMSAHILFFIACYRWLALASTPKKVHFQDEDNIKLAKCEEYPKLLFTAVVKYNEAIMKNSPVIDSILSPYEALIQQPVNSVSCFTTESIQAVFRSNVRPLSLLIWERLSKDLETPQEKIDKLGKWGFFYALYFNVEPVVEFALENKIYLNSEYLSISVSQMENIGTGETVYPPVPWKIFREIDQNLKQDPQTIPIAIIMGGNDKAFQALEKELRWSPPCFYASALTGRSWIATWLYKQGIFSEKILQESLEVAKVKGHSNFVDELIPVLSRDHQLMFLRYFSAESNLDMVKKFLRTANLAEKEDVLINYAIPVAHSSRLVEIIVESEENWAHPIIWKGLMEALTSSREIYEESSKIATFLLNTNVISRDEILSLASFEVVHSQWDGSWKIQPLWKYAISWLRDLKIEIPQQMIDDSLVYTLSFPHSINHHFYIQVLEERPSTKNTAPLKAAVLISKNYDALEAMFDYGYKFTKELAKEIHQEDKSAYEAARARFPYRIPSLAFDSGYKFTKDLAKEILKKVKNAYKEVKAHFGTKIPKVRL